MTIICSIIFFITWSFSFFKAIHILKVPGHYINRNIQYSTARTAVILSGFVWEDSGCSILFYLILIDLLMNLIITILTFLFAEGLRKGEMSCSHFYWNSQNNRTRGEQNNLIPSYIIIIWKVKREGLNTAILVKKWKKALLLVYNKISYQSFIFKSFQSKEIYEHEKGFPNFFHFIHTGSIKSKPRIEKI